MSGGHHKYGEATALIPLVMLQEKVFLRKLCKKMSAPHFSEIQAHKEDAYIIGKALPATENIGASRKSIRELFFPGYHSFVWQSFGHYGSTFLNISLFWRQ